jgi:hypothetical protein
MNQHLERLTGLHPMLRDVVRQMITQCDERLRRTLMAVRGFSSVQDQAATHQKGRTFDREQETWIVTDAKQVVTNSVPGSSAHNVITLTGQPASMAVDVIPLFNDGTPDWSPGQKFWEDLYRIAWKLGLDPLGDPLGAYLPYDKGHFEEPAWRLKLEGLNTMLPKGFASLV